MMDQFKVCRSQYSIMGRFGPVGFYWVRTLVMLDDEGYNVFEKTLGSE